MLAEQKQSKLNASRREDSEYKERNKENIYLSKQTFGKVMAKVNMQNMRLVAKDNETAKCYNIPHNKILPALPGSTSYAPNYK